jgi:hypothetical protein
MRAITAKIAMSNQSGRAMRDIFSSSGKKVFHPKGERLTTPVSNWGDGYRQCIKLR